MRLGHVLLGRRLLIQRADDALYFLARATESRDARDLPVGELWLCTVDAEGGLSGGPVRGAGIGGAAISPFDHFVYGGWLPRGGRTVEAATDTGTYRAKTRPGLWILALQWGNRAMRFELRFLDASGGLIESYPQRLEPSNWS